MSSIAKENVVESIHGRRSESLRFIPSFEGPNSFGSREHYFHFSGLSPFSVRRCLQRIRLLFLKQAGALKAFSSEGQACWLLLRRSPEHEFYRQGGGAKNPRYGTGRCAIGNIDALGSGLIDAGIPIQIYEPGRHSLEDQIRVFHGAKGVLGIRGAEFANLLWMRSGSQALMIATPVERENHASRHLAKVCGIDFAAVKVDSFHPSVSVLEVLRAITLLVLCASCPGAISIREGAGPIRHSLATNRSTSWPRAYCWMVCDL